MSHAMTGRKVDCTTITKLARALTVTPVLPGIDAFILAAPTTSKATGTRLTAAKETEDKEAPQETSTSTADA